MSPQRVTTLFTILTLMIVVIACVSSPQPSATSVHATRSQGVLLDEPALVSPSSETGASEEGVVSTTNLHSVDAFTPEPEASVPPNMVRSFPADSQMLNVVVPPCIPFPGSHIDPCERRDTWPRINPYVSVSYELIQPHPALAEGYLSFIESEYYESAVQFVVRAIPVPGSTRCGTFSSFGTLFGFISGNKESASDHTRCWVDLAVNEYIVGAGPARLTMDIGVWIADGDQDELANEARVFGGRFEGWEWVITLRGPDDPNNASWKLLWHRDVQLTDEGTVVAVSWFKRDYLRHSLPEFRDINLERAEMTLTQYRNQARSAYEKYREATGGRIGAVNDINGNPLPFLADDASVKSLLDYIGQIEVVEATEYTSKSPPPVPGENDPNPDGLRVNDIIATRVAGGVAIPGGLEGTATPVSALGDEPTATATVEWTDSDDTNIIEVERAVPQSACLETGDRPWRGKTEIRYEDVIGDFEAACGGENGMYADACVYNPRIFRKTETTDPPPTRDPDPTELARLEGDHAPYMVINGTNTFSPGDLNGNLCSDAHALIVHEGGHVLGLEHRVGTSVQTVMTVPYSMTTGCVPTSYDVAAVMSIYQSLHVSTTETEESDE